MTYLNNQSNLIVQAEKLVAENPHLSENELVSIMYKMYKNNYQSNSFSVYEQEILTSYTEDTNLTNDRKYYRGPKLTEEHVDELFNVIKTAVKFAIRLKNNRT